MHLKNDSEWNYVYCVHATLLHSKKGLVSINRRTTLPCQDFSELPRSLVVHNMNCTQNSSSAIIFFQEKRLFYRTCNPFHLQKNTISRSILQSRSNKKQMSLRRIPEKHWPCFTKHWYTAQKFKYITNKRHYPNYLLLQENDRYIQYKFTVKSMISTIALFKIIINESTTILFYIPVV